jgi:hypothetical protein
MNLEVLGLNTGWDTIYLEWGFSQFFSLSAGKCQDYFDYAMDASF